MAEVIPCQVEVLDGSTVTIDVNVSMGAGPGRTNYINTRSQGAGVCCFVCQLRPVS